MGYRDFSKPQFPGPRVTVTDWLRWIEAEPDLLISVAPPSRLGCELCHGSVGYKSDRMTTYRQCLQCQRYGNAVDRLIPITYSVDAGLESMLHRYKDFGRMWMRSPLACLLHTFISRHGDCIEEAVGGISIATFVPSGNTERTFDHLDSLVRGAVKGDPLTDRYRWDRALIRRNDEVSRPARGKLNPSSYTITQALPPGSKVLLFDDTWTSGASAASAAAALKQAGASDVTVLTLGRQLRTHNPWGTAQEIWKERRERPWSRDSCVLCA